MQDFKQLRVWQHSHQLTLAVYEVIQGFPNSELYGLTSQMRRASASISMNIAEGCGRGSDAEFARFLQIAMGSASELEYQLILANDLKFLNQDTYEEINPEVIRVKKMLATFIKKLKAGSRQPIADSR